MFLRTSRIHAENLDIARAGLLPVIPEIAKLAGAPGGVVARIEDKNHIAAAEGRERNGVAGVVHRSEIGCRRSDGQGIGEEPGEHHCTVTRTSLLTAVPIDTTIGTAPVSPAGIGTLT